MAENAVQERSSPPGEEEQVEEGEVIEEEEFLPGYQTLPDYSKSLLSEVMKATKAANSLPAEGDDFDYYSSFPGFRTFCNKMGSRITRSINRVIRHQALPCYWPPSQAPPTSVNTSDEEAGLVAMAEELDERMEAIIEANDVLLERVGVLMDEVCGLRKKEEVVVPANLHQGTAEVASWNRKKDSRGGGVASYHFMAMRNVPRPQVKFQDHVDNSKFPFVPRLRDKPNAQQPLPEVYQRLQNPLSLNALIANSKEWALLKQKYNHPYRYELENFEPTDEQLQLREPQAPGSLEEVPYTFISTEGQLDQLVTELASCHEFAIDLEHHSYRSFQGFVCLMQISTRHHDYIIDTLELRHYMYRLLDHFTNPSIVKVMHGADWDIQWLQRDFGLYVVNLFDTGQASRVLRLPKFSLAFLLQYCCGVEADKQYQLADWRIRPLPAVMEKYAREDTHYLLYIYDRMRNELLRRKTNHQNLLQTTLNLSRDVCLKVYEKPVYSDDGYLKLYYKHKRNFNSQQLHCLKLLYGWRDSVAREEDESHGYVLPNHMLFQISEQLPREAQGVLACCTPIPTLLRQQLQEVFMLVQEARQTAVTSEPPKLAPPPQAPPPGPPLITLTSSHPPTVPTTPPITTNTVSGVHEVRYMKPRGPPVETASPSLSAVEWVCPEVSRKVREQLQQIETSFPDVLAQFMEAGPQVVPQVSLPRPASAVTPQTDPLEMTSSVSDVPMTTTPEPETVSKVTGAAKGLKSKRILSVREMGNKRRKVSPPKVDREGEVVEREEGGEEEEEEGEVKRAKVGGEERGEGKEERELKVEREEVVSEFTSFDYRGTNYTDFAEKPSHQPVVFQPRSTNSRDRGGGGLRSKVHMKSGERSHTYSSRQSKKSHLWPRK